MQNVVAKVGAEQRRERVKETAGHYTHTVKSAAQLSLGFDSPISVGLLMGRLLLRCEQWCRCMGNGAGQ